MNATHQSLARSRLGVLRSSQAARRSCRCSRPPIRPESRPRRARRAADCKRYNLRQIMRRVPRSRSSDARGTALHHRPNGIGQERPEPEFARLFQLYCWARVMPAASWSTSASCASLHPQTGDRRAQAVPDIKTLRRRPRGRRRTASRSRPATAICRV